MPKEGWRPRDRSIAAVVLFLSMTTLTADVRAQAPTIPSTLGAEPGSVQSTLGPMPGAGRNPFGQTPGTDPAFLGGRPGPSFPRVPSEVTIPGGRNMPAPARSMVIVPVRPPITDVPLYGPLEIPSAAEEEGPPEGMTLDLAIERLLRENLALAALRWQVPASRADVLTASLRANPVFYADAQLVPYGRYERDRAGGPTQYDVNVSHPVDYSGKRVARTAAAERVVTLVEAQYRDAARVQVDNLYTVFVDVIAARETVRFAEASVVGLEQQVRNYEVLFNRSNLKLPELVRVRLLRESARIGVIQAEEILRHAKRSLAAMLNVPADRAESLQVRGKLADLAPPPPSVEELERIALQSRPDLVASRMGIARAEANIRLARAERFGDAYVLFQPYTFQSNAPSGTKSATSWALGATLPIPLYNRNQGGVLRSRLNQEQSMIEAAAAERRVMTEVQNARRFYETTKNELAIIETDLLPNARRARDGTLTFFVRGSLLATEVENARKDYNEVVRRYRDALVRHRRGMLAINTAVGCRLLP